MAGSIAIRVIRVIKRGYEIWSPHSWLQVYYPLFYLANVTRKDGERRNGKGKVEAVDMAIPIAITSLISWIFWVNVRFLLQDVASKKAQESPPSKREEEAEEDSVNGVPERHLNTDIEIGLKETEVSTRQKIYGPNDLRKHRDWFQVARHIGFSAISLPLEMTAVLAAVMRDWLDLLVICGLLSWKAYTTIFFVIQHDELRASLAGDIKMIATAIRDGKEIKIPATELVPGDIVHISQGETVPADCRLLKINEDVAVDQSAITGESNPVNKFRGDIIYYTTGVLRGDANGVVVAIAPETFVGRTAAMIGDGITEQGRSTRREETMPYFLESYLRLTRAIASMTCALIVLALWMTWAPLIGARSRPKLELALCLAIALAPTGQETVIVGLRALGAARLAHGQTIVQSSANSEALAGIDVLCSDKTGTLTANKLSIDEPYCIGCTPNELMLAACLSLPEDQASLDPINECFVRTLEAYPEAKEEMRGYKLIKFDAFNPESKMITGVVESADSERWTCTRGAPKAVLEMCKENCPIDNDIEDEYKLKAADLARQGFRSLAVARKREAKGGEWELLGLIPMNDPPRDDTAAAIQLSRSLGVDVKMFTGDAIAIAKVWAGKFSLDGGDILNSPILIKELFDEAAQPDEDLIDQTLKACGYAETFPEHKKQLISLLQKHGRRVAVTGDGVNDQPALRTADCGIAVEGASEAAQSAADIVMLAPGIARLVDAIQVSRQIFQQVRSYVVYRTTIVLHTCFVLFGVYVVYGDSSLDPRRILVNLHISDLVGTALSYDDGRTPLLKKPARWSIRSLGMAVLLSIVLSIGSWLTLLAVPDSASKATNPADILSLDIVISQHWLCLLSLTNGRFWTFIRLWKVVGVIVIADVLTMWLYHFGWIGGGAMIDVVGHIWRVSLGTFAASAGVCWIFSDGELTNREVRMQGKEAKDGQSSDEQ